MLKNVPMLFLCLCASVANAQWLNYPSPNTPRARDGKPNLAVVFAKTVGTRLSAAAERRSSAGRRGLPDVEVESGVTAQ